VYPPRTWGDSLPPCWCIDWFGPSIDREAGGGLRAGDQWDLGGWWGWAFRGAGLKSQPVVTKRDRATLALTVLDYANASALPHDGFDRKKALRTNMPAAKTCRGMVTPLAIYGWTEPSWVRPVGAEGIRPGLGRNGQFTAGQGDATWGSRPNNLATVETRGRKDVRSVNSHFKGDCMSGRIYFKLETGFGRKKGVPGSVRRRMSEESRLLSSTVLAFPRRIGQDHRGALRLLANRALDLRFLRFLTDLCKPPKNKGTGRVRAVL